MIRAISIVLIFAIALQTVGCSTWKPLARVDEVREDDRQASTEEQLRWNLTEGTRVRIHIREGARTWIKGRVIDCIIESIGHTTVTVIPFTPYAGGNERRVYSLRFVDIASVEFRESQHLHHVFAAGAVLGFFAMGLAIYVALN